MRSKLLSILIFSILLFPLSASRKTNILEVVKTGNVVEIKKAVSNSVYLNAKFGKNKDNLLHVALENKRDVDVIKLLVNLGVNTEAKNKNNDTPLMYACKFNASPETLSLLINAENILKIEKKSYVLKKNKNKKTAFDFALGNDVLTNELLRYAANPNKVIVDNVPQKNEPSLEETNIVPPLPEVASTTTEELPKLEINTDEAKSTEKGSEDETNNNATTKTEEVKQAVPTTIPSLSTVTANIDNEASSSVETQMDYIRVHPVYLFEGIEPIEEEDEDESKPQKLQMADKKDSLGRTLLMKAAANDDDVTIKSLLYSDANINACDIDNWTPLMYAARFCKNDKTIKLLLENGADPLVKNFYGVTALEIAACHNNSAKVVYALSKACDKKTAQKAFITAINYNRPVEIVQSLFSKQTSANLSYKGMTPLMIACATNTSTDTIEFLLKNGANPRILTNERKNAFDYAKENPGLPRNSIYWSLNVGEKGKD